MIIVAVHTIMLMVSQSDSVGVQFAVRTMLRSGMVNVAVVELLDKVSPLL